MLNVDMIKVNGSIRQCKIQAPAKGGAAGIVAKAKKALGVNVSGHITHESDMIVFRPINSAFLSAIVITAQA